MAHQKETKTVCHDCLLIFITAPEICPVCSQKIKILGSIDSPRFWDPEYFYVLEDGTQVSESTYNYTEEDLRQDSQDDPPP